MFFIKFIITLFVIAPVVAYYSFQAGGHIIPSDGDFNYWGAIITSIITTIGTLWYLGKYEDSRLKKRAASLGVNPEYVSLYADNGLVIDNTNKKIFAGTKKHGKVFNYDDVSSIELEDIPFGRTKKCVIHINTLDFDTPRVTVGYADFSGQRDRAFSKLRAALKIS
ncbi:MULTISPECIES: hypothetical protein [Vibrio harveyi group]|uniref:hypothetical protein n=1 Tax=Vibrio harveyi group TaxID=717610 RepID=UPI0003590671|nr:MULTISPECIES: hypothetical protein [Vibrio harveyi group]HCZ9044766.1 hypothetical protein [Vibrio alginolyticus]AGQ92337.1 hypothetical protein M634_11485 [Vibrio parahaemolyticus O1:Kuk str. FDA_R31]EGQ7674245.1 hypothetical protein [Vibrio parahaemolyticus]EGQ7872924.1 hypothetical protein [Vibrio parahaemolyticus]EGR0911795.1 hypothetical protein [Vibrio parahaemolyticus]